VVDDKGMLLLDMDVSRREGDFFVLKERAFLRPSLVCSKIKNSETTNNSKYLARVVVVAEVRPNMVNLVPVFCTQLTKTLKITQLIRISGQSPTTMVNSGWKGEIWLVRLQVVADAQFIS